MTNHAVVIAGGGPTGLMLAAELALAEVDAVIVERRETQDVLGSRAGGLHAGALELLGQRGVVDRFLSEGQKMQVASFGVGALDIEDLPTRHNHGLALRQSHIERILAAWVAELGVRTHRGRDVTGFTQDDGGVEVGLSDGTTLRARYLVGCDGGRSLVRKTANIDFPGWDASVSYLIAEFATTETPPVGMRRDEDGTFALGPTEDGTRVRLVARERPPRRGDTPTLDDVRAALVALYGSDLGARDASWISRFTDTTRQAATYRAGRVLLAGDAAHVHAPNGGQGLNLGLYDAVNLGWKLAQVVHGTSPDTLLDTYHAERHPLTARILRATMAMTAITRGDERMDALRETLADLFRMDEPRRRYGALLSGLDHRYDLGEGHPLLGRRMPDLEVVTDHGPQRVSALLRDAKPIFLDLDGAHDIAAWPVRRVGARYAGAWELPVVGAVPPPSAVLVRPDGHVAWVGEGSDDGLRAALIRWFGPPRSPAVD